MPPSEVAVDLRATVRKDTALGDRFGTIQAEASFGELDPGE
jgi:hypothetical protein